MKRQELANKLIEKLEYTALAEYHLQIADALKADIESTDKKPGYRKEMTKALMDKYDTVIWSEAYQKAYEYHKKRFDDLQKQLKVEVGGEIYCAFETKILDWIDKNIQLADEPKVNFLEVLIEK